VTGDRSVVATFFRDSNGRLWLDSLEVIRAIGRDYYDVDYSKRYGYIFHKSGISGSREPSIVGGIYFVSGDVAVSEVLSRLAGSAARERNETRKLRKLPTSFRHEPADDLLDWLERHGIQDSAVWCSTCRDWFPGESLCEHAWWCNQQGWYSTPDERCACANREECRDL